MSLKLLERELEELIEELGMKEEYLEVLEEQVNSIRHENQRKLQLAQNTHRRHRTASPRGARSRSVSPMPAISEGAEDEEEDCGSEGSGTASTCAAMVSASRLSEEVNEKTAILVKEVSGLRERWELLETSCEDCFAGATLPASPYKVAVMGTKWMARKIRQNADSTWFIEFEDRQTMDNVKEEWLNQVQHSDSAIAQAHSAPLSIETATVLRASDAADPLAVGATQPVQCGRDISFAIDAPVCWQKSEFMDEGALARGERVAVLGHVRDKFEAVVEHQISHHQPCCLSKCDTADFGQALSNVDMERHTQLANSNASPQATDAVQQLHFAPCDRGHSSAPEDTLCLPMPALQKTDTGEFGQDFPMWRGSPTSIDSMPSIGKEGGPPSVVRATSQPGHMHAVPLERYLPPTPSGPATSVRRIFPLSPLPRAFWEAVKRIRALTHPSVCPLLNVSEQRGCLAFVSELCEGPPLLDRVVIAGIASEAALAHIMLQVVQVVEHAHRCGVGHGALHLGAVHFQSTSVVDMRVRVTDWGLGLYRSFAARTPLATELEGLLCEAPEDSMPFECGAVDSASVWQATQFKDLWSLGVLMYTLVCGRLPFGLLCDAKSSIVHRVHTDSLPVSELAKDLLSSLLVPEPRLRLPMERILTHPWLQSRPPGCGRDVGMQEACGSLRQLMNASKLLNICVSAAADQLDQDRMHALRKLFQGCGSSKYEVVDLPGLIDVISQLLEAGELVEQIQHALTFLDLDRSSSISCVAFCNAVLEHRANNQAEVLWSAFAPVPGDTSEHITSEQALAVLAQERVREAWSSNVCEMQSADLQHRLGNSISFRDLLARLHSSAWPKSNDCSGAAATNSHGMTHDAVASVTATPTAVGQYLWTRSGIDILKSQGRFNEYGQPAVGSRAPELLGEDDTMILLNAGCIRLEQASSSVSQARPGFDAISLFGQPGFDGIAPSRHAGFEATTPSGHPALDAIAPSGDPGFDAIARSGDPGPDSIAPSGHPGFDACAPFRDSENMSAWVSVDPRTSQVVFYPGAVAARIEAAWQQGEDEISLGDSFHNAVLHWPKGDRAKPFQKTPTGYRQVRRVLFPHVGDRVGLWVKGVSGEHCFADMSESMHAMDRSLAVSAEFVVRLPEGRAPYALLLPLLRQPSEDASPVGCMTTRPSQASVSGESPGAASLAAWWPLPWTRG